MFQRVGNPSSALHHASSVASVASTPYKFAMGPGALTKRTLHPVLAWTQHLTVAPLNSKGSCSSNAALLAFFAARFLGLAFGGIEGLLSAVERCESWTSNLLRGRSCFRGLRTGERGSSGSNSSVFERPSRPGSSIGSARLGLDDVDRRAGWEVFDLGRAFLEAQAYQGAVRSYFCFAGWHPSNQ